MTTVLDEIRAEVSRESYVPDLTGAEPYKRVSILAAQHADMLLAVAEAAAGLFAEIEATVGCTCGPEYTGRGLSSPHCPLHSTDLDCILAEWKVAVAPLLAESAAG